MSEPFDLGLQYMHGQYTGPDSPWFCRTCGRSMRITQRRSGFDPVTGYPVIERTARCSAPWWAMLNIFAFHDQTFGQDSHGSWPWR